MGARTDNPPPQALFPCQEELLALFETLIDVIFCAKDRAGRYIAANTAFVRRTGKASKREVIGSVSSDHFIPALAERYERQDQTVLATGRAMRDELELIHRTEGEPGWYLTTKLPVLDRLGDEPIGVVSVSRDLRTPSEASIEIAGLQTVAAYVKAQLGGPIRVADVAAAAGCSAEQLNRRMRRVFGLTTAQYVLRVRVDTASDLLRHGSEPIATVAAICGFYDQSSFTHRFARLTNTTPAQFRAQYRRN